MFSAVGSWYCRSSSGRLGKLQLPFEPFGLSGGLVSGASIASASRPQRSRTSVYEPSSNSYTNSVSPHIDVD